MPDDATPRDALPYRPTASRALDPMLRMFRTVNTRVAVPALSAGFGPFVTTSLGGSLLVLRTTGRRSGQQRSTPLGYAVLDGRIVVMAGYGGRSDWFRNALADPRVEVVLPGAVLTGTAAEVTDPEHTQAAVRALLGSMRIPGLLVGDVRTASPERVAELAAGLPVLAITPTGVLPGPFDPGGVLTRANTAAVVLAPVLGAVALVAWRVRRRARVSTG